MKRILLASLVMATGAAVLAACSAAPPLMQTADAPKAAAVEGTASIKLRTNILSTQRQLLADVITPYGLSDVKTLKVYLYLSTDSPSFTDPTTPPTGAIANKPYTDPSATTTVNFTNLKPNTSYKVLAVAYDNGTPNPKIINYATAINNIQSITAKTDVNGNSDQDLDPVTVTVKLDDKPFAGYANGNTITIQDGGYTHTGLEGIEDPAP